MPLDLSSLTIKKAHRHLLAGDFTALELTEAYLANIEAKNKDLNAYLEVFDDAREQAKAADLKLKNLEPAKRAELPNLFGIPLAIKDVILIEGRRVSASSRILEGYRASYDATVVKKLKNAGAVFLGRTNCDEFAMGGSTENSAFGVTHNPHDFSRVSGGSSGGSAAAVAAGLALAALGSDTGGSVREPASFCGIVGMKPTYGAVSRSGLIAMGSSLDCIGPMTKTTDDAEIIFECIRGRDPLDSTSIELKVKSEKLKVEGLTVGVPRSFLEMKGIDADVLANFDSSIGKLKRSGHTIRDVSLPTLPHSLAAYYIIMPAEASTNLARFDGVKYGLHKAGETLLDDYSGTRGAGFGPEVRRRIMLGTYVLSSGYYDAYYRKAIAVRSRIRDELSDAFREVDVIATPSVPAPAWNVGEKGDPLSMYLADIFTVPANIAGIPAISIPSGFVERGGDPSTGGGRVRLPLGFQLMAGYGNDRLLFEIGKAFEAV